MPKNYMGDIANRKDIERLMTAFYNRVFQDELIGFIFTEIAPINPETHLPIIVDFWEMVLFSQSTYHGNIIMKHVQLYTSESGFGSKMLSLIKLRKLCPSS